MRSSYAGESRGTGGKISISDSISVASEDDSVAENSPGMAILPADPLKVNETTDRRSSQPGPKEFIGSLAIVKPGFVLVFRPKSKLTRCDSTFTVRRDFDPSNRREVLFKIMTNRPDCYRIKPYIGVLQPVITIGDGDSMKEIKVTLLPHGQHAVKDDVIVIHFLRTLYDQRIRNIKKNVSKVQLEDIWTSLMSRASGADTMRVELKCDINVDEVEANEQARSIHALNSIRNSRSTLGDQCEEHRLRPTMRGIIRDIREWAYDLQEIDDWPKERICGTVVDDEVLMEMAERDDELMTKLISANNTLRQKTKCIRCFQIFVIISIFILCAILVWLIATPRLGNPMLIDSRAKDLQ